jgi:Uma2 family endonuclease
MVCGPDQRSEKDPRALANPSLILEILSDSTEAKDRGMKFRHYRQLPSLREYVLISQTEAAVDTYYRTDNGTWEIESILGLDQSVLLKSIGGTLALADIYRNVDGLAEGG